MTRSPFLRFFAVSVLGIAVDLTTAWFASTRAGVPLPLAAGIGFATGAAFNYLMHEFWTFREGAVQVSARRGLLYLLTLGATLGVRVGAVAILGQFVPSGTTQNMAVLIAAAGLSFIVNYWLSRHVVFRPVLTQAPLKK